MSLKSLQIWFWWNHCTYYLMPKSCSIFQIKIMCNYSRHAVLFFPRFLYLSRIKSYTNQFIENYWSENNSAKAVVFNKILTHSFVRCSYQWRWICFFSINNRAEVVNYYGSFKRVHRKRIKLFINQKRYFILKKLFFITT